MIDLYCERRGPGLLAEPLNAITNLAFIAAAIAGWVLVRRLRVSSFGAAALIVLAFAVGVGSMLFHTFATPWAKALDLIPILVFQLVFLGQYLFRSVRMTPLLSTVAVVGYFAACLLMLTLPPYLNGSITYAPTLLALVALAVFHVRTGQPGRWLLAAAAIVFAAALTFRTLDAWACPYVPFGTHFLWHLLNGLLLYLAMKALILRLRLTSVSAT